MGCRSHRPRKNNLARIEVIGGLQSRVMTLENQLAEAKEARKARGSDVWKSIEKAP